MLSDPLCVGVCGFANVQICIVVTTQEDVSRMQRELDAPAAAHALLVSCTQYENKFGGYCSVLGLHRLKTRGGRLHGEAIGIL